jgi:predicted permease
MLRHVRHALRIIRVHPGSSLAIVVTLALAIAANSTLFAVVNAVLLTPLPVRDPGSLVNVYTSRSDGEGHGGLSYPDFEDLRGSHAAFRDAIGYSGLMVTVSDDRSSEVIFGELVTPEYFDVLGVRPAIGSGLREDSPDAIVIGDRLWRQRFGADRAVIGRPILLNGRSYRVAGVAPPTFAGLLFRGISADVWMPVGAMPHVRTDQRTNRGERWLFVKARLPRGTAVSDVRAAAAVISARLAADHPGTNTGRALRVIPAADVLVHPDGDRAILPAAAALVGAGLLVLLVACANLAGVMLARGLARSREIAIRLSLGATRARVAAGLIVEGVMLAAAGGVAGLLLARWAAAALTAWRPDLPVPVSLRTAIDWRVAAFTFIATAIATVAFAVLPALRASRTPAAGSMTAPRRRARRWFTLREALIVPQLAIALLLVAVAALFARSLARVDAVDPGFDTSRTAFVSLNLAMSGYDDERARRFYDELASRLGAGGAVASALTDRMPLDIYGNRTATVSFGEGFGATRGMQTARVGEAYFDTLGIPILRGRPFTRADTGASVIVSASAARQLWPGADPIGQPLRLGDRTLATVVGVAADAKVQTLAEVPEPLVYQPLADGHAGLLRLVVRTTGDPRPTVDALRAAVRGIDARVGVFEARTVGDYLDVMLYPYRLAAAVASVLGLLTLALAAVGLYGLLACGVTERLRELAIRVAIGAGPRAVVRHATAPALGAAVVGSAGGALLAAVAGRLLATVLFGISPFDPWALGGTALVLFVVIAAAAAAPVRRALRLAPMSILRGL